MALFDRLFNRNRILELQEKNDKLAQLLKESLAQSDRLIRQSQTDLDTSTSLTAQLCKANDELQAQVYALKAQIQEAEFFPVYKARKDYYAVIAEYTKLIESIKSFLSLNVPDDGSSDNDRIRKILMGLVDSMHSINKKVFTAMTSK